MTDDVNLEKYRMAAAEVGFRFVSMAMRAVHPTGNPKEDFLTDHEHFMRENKQDLRVRTIGGSKLDIYCLYVNVLEQGGIQAVTSNRAFKTVARALNLPKSCTSAATVLRTSYMEQLYMYEQKHVFDRIIAVEDGLNPDYRRLSGLSPIPLRGKLGSGSAASSQVPASVGRPRRQAALAASSAVAQAVSDDPYEMQRPPKRGRTGIDDGNLSNRHRAIVEEELAKTSSAKLSFNPSLLSDRERLVAALKCSIDSEVAWALGTLNVLSFNSRSSFHAHNYPGLCSAIQNILSLHMDDVIKRRTYGTSSSALRVGGRRTPRNSRMSLVPVEFEGDPLSGLTFGQGRESSLCESSFLQASNLEAYDDLFNLVDSAALDREQCAVVAVNVLRNMSFSDSNAVYLASSKSLLETTAVMLMTYQISLAVRVSIIEMWVNLAPYLNVSSDAAGHVVLTTCIRLLDPFLEGADHSRFTNAGEILARLAASPERNENAMVEQFPELLPRIIDMLGGRDRRYVTAALAALCNCSAFDWPARGRIARVPRAIPRLITMLHDQELSPRASLTLLNLAEAPSNRSVMLMYEKQLVSHAVFASPAAETIASVLYDLSSWD